MPRDEATSRYLGTAGDDFRTQLDAIACGHPSLDDIAADFEAAKEGLMGGCRPFADAGAAIDRLEALRRPRPHLQQHALSSSRSFAGATGSPSAQLRSTAGGRIVPRWGSPVLAAAIGVAPNDVLFVGDAPATLPSPGPRASVRRALSSRPPGRVLADVPVVTSLTDLARLVATARRSPVTVAIPAGEVAPSVPAPLAASRPRRSRWPTWLARTSRRTPSTTYRRDGAVGDLDVPVDLGSRPKRPGDRGPHHGIVGEHHGRARGD